jgi:hypothetical protein
LKGVSSYSSRYSWILSKLTYEHEIDNFVHLVSIYVIVLWNLNLLLVESSDNWCLDRKRHPWQVSYLGDTQELSHIFQGKINQVFKSLKVLISWSLNTIMGNSSLAEYPYILCTFQKLTVSFCLITVLPSHK